MFRGEKSKAKDSQGLKKVILHPLSAAMKCSQGNVKVGCISFGRLENGKVLKCITQRGLKDKSFNGKTQLDEISACSSSPWNPPVKIAIIVFVLLCARVSIGAICETLLAAALRMFYHYRSSSLFLDLIKLDHGQTDPTINALDVRKTKSWFFL